MCPQKREGSAGLFLQHSLFMSNVLAARQGYLPANWDILWSLSVEDMYGKHSYEVYLTHMFVVFAFFDLFVYLGKSLRLAPILFTVVILMAGFPGLLIATTYSEPVNRFRRSRYGNKMLSKCEQSEKESSR